MKRSQSITARLIPALSLAMLLAIWLGVSESGMVAAYLLPSPRAVWRAFVADLPLLLHHARVTLTEAGCGLGLGIGLAFLCAALMDRFAWLDQALSPLLVLTQTIPTIAIAPLLVLWLGFSMAPKIALVLITTFFPIAVSLRDGYRSADPDAIDLIRSMGGGRVRIFFFVKLPSAMGAFFSGLKVSASYAVVGAVIAEWLGGFEGLGVYMTRVKKAYAFDKMFAVIGFVSLISLGLMGLISGIRRICMPWEERS